MSFSINNNLCYIDNFQVLSSSLDSLVKTLAKDNFKYLSQEFDNNVLDLVKQKVFYLHKYLSGFEKFKEQLPSKEKFHTALTSKNIIYKEYEHVFKVWYKLEMKTMKAYHDLYSAVVFKKFRNKTFKNYGLCPSHYMSTPVLNWDAMLNIFLIGIIKATIGF